MALFFKKKGDVGVVDLSDLQRRGIFKPRTIPRKTITPTDSQGYADLSTTPQNTTSSTSSNSNQSSSGGGMFDWFSGLAKSNNQTETNNTSASSSEYGSMSQGSDSNLKNKIDDLEFKMENMSRKLNNFLERLELIEKKINRLEGRGY